MADIGSSKSQLAVLFPAPPRFKPHVTHHLLGIEHPSPDPMPMPRARLQAMMPSSGLVWQIAVDLILSCFFPPIGPCIGPI